MANLADETKAPAAAVEDAKAVAVAAAEKPKSLLPQNVLIQISRSLSDRLREAKTELAKEIADAQAVHLVERRPGLSAAPVGAALDDIDEHAGPTEMFMEMETAEEKMRSTYWGLELLYRTGAIDPATQIYALWLAVVSLAFSYNMWTMTLREAFPQYGNGSALIYWLILDYICDAIYLFDMFAVKTRILYHNEDGLMVFDKKSMRNKYFKSTSFKLDLLSLLPLDILYVVPQIGVRPLLRIFRLIRLRSFWEFFDRVSGLLDSPDILRIFKILVYILLMVHLYTCCYYAFSVHVVGIGVGDFAFEGEVAFPAAYARCFYIAFKIATSINSDKELHSTQERAFMIIAWLVATFVVVVLLAQIRETFFEFTREDDEFTRLVYTAMSYMKRYNCPTELENKVRSWFIYMRSTQRVLEIQKVLAFLPKHIQTALALEINYKTLSKVTLFQNCDRTVLTDLVVKLKPVLYLPGDYICKKGEIGKEMYIIVKGQAEVVSNEGKVFVTLSAGAVFGEISLLAVGGANRRTANVRSKGFSNLFTLSKDDFEEIMQQYPLIYARLKKRVAETLAKSAAPAPPPPPPPAAEGGATDQPKKEIDEKAKTPAKTPIPAKRPKTPKLLQILRAVLPNMPTLRRIFRVEPIDEKAGDKHNDTASTSDSLDAELQALEWSTPSPDNHYVLNEAEQQFWDAPESVTVSSASYITDSYTYRSDDDDSGESDSTSTGNNNNNNPKSQPKPGQVVAKKKPSEPSAAAAAAAVKTKQQRKKHDQADEHEKQPPKQSTKKTVEKKPSMKSGSTM